jgi:hypothetical protein
LEVFSDGGGQQLPARVEPPEFTRDFRLEDAVDVIKVLKFLGKQIVLVSAGHQLSVVTFAEYLGVFDGAIFAYGAMVEQALSAAAILHEQGRLSGLSGLGKQGLARTLNGEIEMPEECARAGEVLLSPGVCGPRRTPT